MSDPLIMLCVGFTVLAFASFCGLVLWRICRHLFRALKFYKLHGRGRSVKQFTADYERR